MFRKKILNLFVFILFISNSNLFAGPEPKFPWWAEMIATVYFYLFPKSPDPKVIKASILHEAVKKQNNSEEILRLIKDGADLNSTQETYHQTPLMYAFTNNREEAAIILLENGADVNKCERRSASPIHHAIKKSKISTIKLLIDKGANINEKNYIDDMRPLHLACESGRLEMVKFLLENGAKEFINEKAIFGKTPLHFTFFNIYSVLHLSKESFNLLNLLLFYGADLNSRDNKGNTVLKLLTEQNENLSSEEEKIRKKIINFLISKGAIK